VVLICSRSVPCDGVELNNVNLKFNGAPVDAKCVNAMPILKGIAPKCISTAVAA
jgi:galacturan 1,4-alpha-galacturonidase